MNSEDKTLLEWFGCEEGMTVDEIKTRLKEIFDNGLEEDI